MSAKPRQCECIAASTKQRCKRETMRPDFPYCASHKNCEKKAENIEPYVKRERKTPTPKKTSENKPKTPEEKKESKSEAYVEPLSSRTSQLPVSVSSRRLRGISPTDASSRRLRVGDVKEDISTRSSRRYLLPARLLGFRNFLCNMLEYNGYMTRPLDYYPIGYISYLLRAYSYDTSSITPFNVTEDAKLQSLLNGGIELNQSFTFPLLKDGSGYAEYKADYVKDSKNKIIIPATIVYNSTDSEYCIYMKNDLARLIRNIPQRHIAIFVREITIDGEKNTLKDTYLPIFIDQKEDRKTIDIIPELEETKAEREGKASDAVARASSPRGGSPRAGARAVSPRALAATAAAPGASDDYSIDTIRRTALEDLFETTGTDYKIRIHNSVPTGVNPRVWQIMLIHLKLINPVLSFDQIQTEFMKEIDAERKDLRSIVYSYFMKISRLSTNEQVDYDLLSIFHGTE